MLIYVDEVQREIDDILAYAGLIREKFDAGREPAELLLDAKAPDVRIENLYAVQAQTGVRIALYPGHFGLGYYAGL